MAMAPLSVQVQLQWGHGFSAVEIIMILTVVVLPTMLQWGHGFSAVEMSFSVPAAMLAVAMASMGPRLFSRGNSRTIHGGCRSSSRFNGATAFQPWK